MGNGEAKPISEVIMTVDYRKYPLGVALSDEIILKQCPVCGQPAHEKHTSKGYEFIHKVVIERLMARGENRPIVDVACRQTDLEHSSRKTYPGPKP